MTQETNESTVQADDQQFISVCAGSDDTIWGINLAGDLISAHFTWDPTTGDRKVTWQPIPSETGWKQVAVGASPGLEEGLWCLDKGGNVYRVIVIEGVSGKQQIGNMTLSFLSAGADGTTWGLDAGGKAFLFDNNSKTWTAQTQPRSFTRLSVADATHVMALDSDGAVYALEQNGSWQSIGSGFIDISLPKDGAAFAVGQKGNLLIQVDNDWFDAGGEGLKSISAGSLSNVVTLDGQGNFTDLTQGQLISLGTDRNQSRRFETEDPFNEKNSTHLWIVNRGANLAGGEFGDKFRQLFQPNLGQTGPVGSAFHQAVCQGLYDADFVTFFNGPATIFNNPTWESHFYDPDTQLNWRGHASPTALTRGRELFNSALAAYRAGRLEQAGYALGASLHYLTDMGQPMHAANFTAVSIPMFWHGGFETIVMNIQDQCPVPTTQTPDDASQRPFHIPDDYFINLARKSKQLYQQRFKYGIGGLFDCDLGGLGHRPQGEQLTGVKTLLQPMLTNAIQAVAHYVTEWMKRAEDRVSLSHPPICAGNQGHDWASVLWSVDQFGQLKYSYAALNMDPVGSPLLSTPVWFTGTPSGTVPAAPTQLANCMSLEEYDGRELVFAVAKDGLYYNSQIPPSGPDNQIANGWGSWTKLENAPSFNVICACPYTYKNGPKVTTTGVSVWGVGEDGLLRFAYERSKTDGVKFDPFNNDQIVWTDWQVVNSAPKNMTCLTAAGLGDRTGYIFGLADGVVYASSQNDPQNGGGWTSWAKFEIFGQPTKLRLICAAQAKLNQNQDYRVQLWGVDDQGLLRSTTFSSIQNQWSAWSGEWNANAPRNAVALTASLDKPDSQSLQLWAFAGGKLYAIYEKFDVQTSQQIWSDWSAVPTYDVSMSTKVSLPIGPLKLTMVGHDLPFLVMLIEEDPDRPILDPSSAIRNIRMAITDDPKPGDWMPGTMNLLTGALYDVTDGTGGFTTTWQGQFSDNTHGSGTTTGKGTDSWTTSGLTTRSGQPEIVSVSPADQVAAGWGQLLLIRGSDLPNVVVVSQDGHEYLPEWVSSATPEAALVRLPVDLHPGSAIVRLTNADHTVTTPDFSIVISTTPGTPVITAVTSDRLAPITKVSPGQKIAITAEGMDTSSAIIEWTHPSLPILTSASEMTMQGVDGISYCVVTTVPNVTPNDTWTVSLRVQVSASQSAPSLWPLQT